MNKYLKYLLWIVTLPIGSSAQSDNQLKEEMFVVQDSIFLDSLSIVRSSIIVFEVDSTSYNVNPVSSLLTWKVKPKTDSIKIWFRTMAIDLDYHLQHKDYKKIELSGTGVNSPFKYTAVSSQNLNNLSNGLNKNGSISRGVAF